jgi:hypothetical protein
METPFFYGQETKESAEYNQDAADLSKFKKTGLTDPEDIVPLVRSLVSEGWWITDRRLLPTADTQRSESCRATDVIAVREAEDGPLRQILRRERLSALRVAAEAAYARSKRRKMTQMR